jgi:hypothetical protein
MHNICLFGIVTWIPPVQWIYPSKNLKKNMAGEKTHSEKNSF